MNSKLKNLGTNTNSALSLDQLWERDFFIQAAILFDVMWFARNQSVHEGIIPIPADLVSNLKRRLMEHRAAWREHDIIQNLVWHPPEEGFLKFNCDVAVRGHMSFLASFTRDHRGNFLYASSDFVISTNPLLAELKAILLAVQTAESSQAHSAIFESDTLSSCKIVTDLTFLVEGPLVYLANSIRSFFERNRRWHLQWIPRRQNQAAHQMAAWIASDFICDFFSADLLPLSVILADDPLILLDVTFFFSSK